MIGHQDIGVDRATYAPGDIAKFAQIASTIDLLEEAGAAIIAALYDVLRDVRQVETGLAGHATFPCELRAVSENRHWTSVGGRRPFG